MWLATDSLKDQSRRTQFGTLRRRDDSHPGHGSKETSGAMRSTPGNFYRDVSPERD